jgi:hypothetical protein
MRIATATLTPGSLQCMLGGVAILIMIVLLTRRTKALNELGAALVVSLRCEISGADGPVKSANVERISGESAAQSVLTNPLLSSLALCEHARSKVCL